MKPLLERRVVVTRPRGQAALLANLLSARGAVPIIFPTIEIAAPADAAPLQDAIARLAGYDWVVFTSANSVAAFWDCLESAGGDGAALAGRKLGAVGPATARALASRGLPASVVPEVFVAEALASAIEVEPGQRVLLPQAELAREALADALRARGAHVDAVTAYRTLPAAPDAAGLDELRRGVDAVTFTSASSARNFAALLAQHPAPIETAVIACIGPITAAAAAEAGLRVAVQAASYTIEGLVEALEAYYGRLAGQAEEELWTLPPLP
jgi:uroporphyrinogen-III synthase